MRPTGFLRELRNRFDFALRSRMRSSHPIESLHLERLKLDVFQKELHEFLSKFPWRDCGLDLKQEHLWECLDVGAKNFATGPVIDQIFMDLGMRAHIIGIEIDPFRRSRDWRTRADYAQYYLRQMRSGSFFGNDVLRWNREADIAFLLNPFVTEIAHSRWGLPQKLFRPAEQFEHLHRLLLPSQGLLVHSSPSTHEFELSRKIATRVGFVLMTTISWQPTEDSIQSQPRYGSLWRAE